MLLVLIGFTQGLKAHEDDESAPTGTLDELPQAVLFDWGQAPPHWAEPLDAPDWRDARLADFMDPDDPVLGLSVGEESWAIPWWVMKNHHVANVELAGRPILLTFCEVCSSGAAFLARVKGIPLRFRLAGLYNGTNLIVDEHTGSYWAPFMGEALAGPLKGTRLPRYPLVQSRWSEWLGLHPETRVAFAPAGVRRGHGSNMEPGSLRLTPQFRSTLVRPLDTRMARNELVLGVEMGGDAVAFPLSGLHDATHGAVNGQPIVVFNLPGGLLAIAYSRIVDDLTLSFERVGPAAFRDPDTGSTWNLSGDAIEGPLAGRSLRYVPSGVEEWYVWAAYHSNTRIHEGPVGDAADPP